MKLPPATLLVLAMFGSFVIILAVMIAVFRPEPRPLRRAVKKATVQTTDILNRATPEPDTLQRVLDNRKPAETPPPAVASTKPKAPIPITAEASRRIYRELELEQKENAALRADIERQLRKAQRDHQKKLAHLARRCEPLEPGEAVQILIDLRDADIATVLRHMKPDRAVPIMTLLKRLGRKKVITLLNK